MQIDNINANTSSNSSSLNLPSEIFELIGTHLKPSTLLRLSLVNRDLLKLSRRRRFSRLKFDHIQGAQKLDRFLDLLEGPYSTLAPFVKCFIFEELVYHSSVYTPKARPHARNLGSRLVNVQSVRMEKMKWDFTTPDLLAFFVAIPTQELIIISFQGFSVDQWEMLNNMRQGCRVFLSGNLLNYSAWEKDIPPSNVFIRPMHITLLDINALSGMEQVWDPNIFNGVGGVVSVERLLVAQMGEVYLDRMPFIRRFLKHIAHSLKHLVIEIDSISRRPRGIRVDPLKNLFDPSTAWNISEILVGPLHTLAPRPQGSIYAPDYLQKTIQRILLHVPTAQLKVLTLTCSVWQDPHEWIKSIDQYPWKQVLTRITEAIPSLTRLKVIIKDCSSKPLNEAVERAKGQMLEVIGSQAQLEISVLPYEPEFPVKRWWED